MSDIDYTAMSDEELRTLEHDLAAQRTAIRLDQNAVQAELELRTFMAGLSGAAKQELRNRLTLAGGVKPTGDTK